MRIADYLADTLYQAGVADIFIVTGGGLMFLTDGLACHKHLRPVPCLHEQPRRWLQSDMHSIAVAMGLVM